MHQGLQHFLAIAKALGVMRECFLMFESVSGFGAG